MTAAAVVALVAGSGAAPSTLSGQQPSLTTLTGGLAIGLGHGTISGDFCLTPPVITDTVTFVLNRSLSVLDVRGGRLLPELTTEQPGGAAIRYRMVRNERQPDALPEPVCVVYEGAETIHDIGRGQYRESDGSEVIAFNGSTVRARGYARWYPAMYDPGSDLTTEAEIFRVTIRCDECRTIYVNGGPPSPGPQVTFDSGGRRELFLLAGDFDFAMLDGDLVVGEPAPDDSTRYFLKALGEIRHFQESYLGVPFGDDFVLLRAEPVRAPRRGRLWGFYSDPTLSLIGMSMSEFVLGLEGRSARTRRSLLGFMGHELGHRYFGWTLGWSSPQRDLFSEPFATFLELKTVRHFLGQREYQRAVQSLINRVTGDDVPTPLTRSTATTYAYDSYRYGYAPLQLLALESVIGEERMRSLLRAMLEAPEEERAVADLAFMRRWALRVGVAEGEWEGWVAECVEPAPAESPCIRRLAG